MEEDEGGRHRAQSRARRSGGTRQLRPRRSSRSAARSGGRLSPCPLCARERRAAGHVGAQGQRAQVVDDGQGGERWVLRRAALRAARPGRRRGRYRTESGSAEGFAAPLASCPALHCSISPPPSPAPLRSPPPFSALKALRGARLGATGSPGPPPGPLPRRPLPRTSPPAPRLSPGLRAPLLPARGPAAAEAPHPLPLRARPPPRHWGCRQPGVGAAGPCRAVPCSGLLGEAAEAASSSFAAAAALDAGLGLLGCEVGRRAHRGRVCVRVYACVCVVCARARRCAGGSAPPRRGSMIALSSRCACAVSRSV